VKDQLSLDGFALIGRSLPDEPLDLSPLVSLEAMERDVVRAEEQGSPFAETLRAIFERKKETVAK
jgi:hypothetical protein